MMGVLGTVDPYPEVEMLGVSPVDSENKTSRLM